MHFLRSLYIEKKVSDKIDDGKLENILIPLGGMFDISWSSKKVLNILIAGLSCQTPVVDVEGRKREKCVGENVRAIIWL